MKTYFKFKQHPGDLFRDNSIQVLPDINKNQEDFWLWFHPDYIGSETVAYLNDLYKWVEDIGDGVENSEFEDCHGKMSLDEIQEQINTTEKRLVFESLENFYHLLKIQKVEIIKENI